MNLTKNIDLKWLIAGFLTIFVLAANLLMAAGYDKPCKLSECRGWCTDNAPRPGGAATQVIECMRKCKANCDDDTKE